MNQHSCNFESLQFQECLQRQYEVRYDLQRQYEVRYECSSKTEILEMNQNKCKHTNYLFRFIFAIVFKFYNILFYTTFPFIPWHQ